MPCCSIIVIVNCRRPEAKRFHGELPKVTFTSAPASTTLHIIVFMAVKIHLLAVKCLVSHFKHYSVISLNLPNEMSFPRSVKCQQIDIASKI